MSNKRSSYPLHRSCLYRIGKRRDLASLLGLELTKLCELAGPGHRYSHFPLPKKTGGTRMVDNPREDLKRVQKRIGVLLSRIMPPEFLFCPVKGRSYVSNAAQHRGNRIVHSLDVKKYFPSTPSRRVYWFFHSVMDCTTDVASVLAKIACCDGYLPTGSPLSPIMAYYAHVDVWENVARIAREHDLVITVYVDDITVSGSRVPTAVIWQIKKALYGGGLRYHKEKRSVDRPTEVTGVVLRDGQLLSPNRQRDKLRKLRRASRRARNPEIKKALDGKIAGLDGQVTQIATANQTPNS